MLSIYFLGYQHQENYRKLVRKWSEADPLGNGYGKANPEYQAAIYIASTPIIFEKVGKFLLSNKAKKPVDWFWLWLEWHGEYKEEWESYRGSNDELHPEHNAWIDRKPFDLTGAMVHLGHLALNLWNDSNNEFNLTRAMGTFDGNNINIMLCAIYIRQGFFKTLVI